VWIRQIGATLLLIAVPLAIGRTLRRRGVGAAMQWYAGVQLLGVLLVLMHALGTPRPAAAALLAGVAIGCVAHELYRWRAWQSPSEFRSALPIVLALAVLAVPAIVQTLAAPVNEWDAVAIWYAKARGLAAWQPLAELSVPNYPNLGAAIWAIALTLIGSAAEPVSRLIFPFLYLAWVASLHDLVPRVRPWTNAPLVLVAVAPLFQLQAVTSGYQDVALMAAAGMSALFYSRALAAGAPADALWGAAFAAVLPLVKTEGVLLGAALSAAWALLSPLPARRQAATVAIFLAGAAAWPLLLLLNGVDPTRVQGEAFYFASLLDVPQRLNRWGAMQPYFARHFLPRLGVIGAAALLSAATFHLLPALRRAVVFLWFVAGLHLLLLFAIFFSTEVDLDWHLGTAFTRLALQGEFVWPTVTVLCAGRLIAATWPLRDEASSEALAVRAREEAELANGKEELAAQPPQ